MPSASTAHAAFEALRDFQSKIADKVVSMDHAARVIARRRSERASEAVQALVPLVREESERLVSEAAGHLQAATDRAVAWCARCEMGHDVWGVWTDGGFVPEDPERLACPGCLSPPAEVRPPRSELGEAA